jgi:CheY-like chemotaxis protein
MSERQAGRIVAIVRDLFFAARIRDTLRPRGYVVAVVKREEELAAAFAGDPVALVIIDLAFTAIAPPAVIARLKSDAATGAVPLLAFGSHLDRAGREAAKAAGADRVVPNSKLVADLPALVERYARGQMIVATDPVEE